MQSFSQKRHIFFFAGLLLVLCVLAYAGGLSNGFNVDDFNFIEGKLHPYFESFGDYFVNTPTHHYGPFNMLLNISLFRNLNLNPVPFRLFNLALFYFNSLLVFLLIKKLFNNFRLGAITSLLFCLHPINTEVLSHITMNIILLYNILMLLTLLTFWSYLNDKRKIGWLICSIFIFYLALLSQELAILLPVFVFSALMILKNYKIKEAIIESAPFILMSTVYVLMWFSKASGNAGLIAKISSLELSVFSYIASLFHLIAWYIKNLILPDSIVFIYNSAIIERNALFLSSIFLITIAAISYSLYRWRSNKIFTLGIVWFMIGFVITLPAMFAHAHMGVVIEPYWYFFSSIGFFLLIAHMLISIKPKLLSSTLMIGVLLFCFYYVQKYIVIGKTETSYSKHWLKVCPTNTLAMMRLATNYAQNPKTHPEALEYYHKILMNKPPQLHRIYYNIGLIWLHQNDLNKAKSYINKSLAMQPNYAQAHNSLATIFHRERNLRKSEDHFIKAFELAPHSTLIAINVSNHFIINNQETTAIEILEKHLQTQPIRSDQKFILAKLAALYTKQHNFDRSFEYIERYLTKYSKLQDYFFLSDIYTTFNLNGMAVEIIKQAAQQYPQEPDIYFVWGVKLANQGIIKEAVKIWRQGQSINADDKRFALNIQKAQKLLINN